MEKVKRQPKVKNSTYSIKIDGILKENNIKSLAKARKILKSLSLPEGAKSVEIVRSTTTETTINTFKPKKVTVLEIDDLDEDL